MVIIKEMVCNSLLNKTSISGADYCINPYIGCQHSCDYCYARFMKRQTRHKEPWGAFVDVKINAPQILSKQLAGARRGLVLISTVTDPYQPVERKYEITRMVLERLVRHRFQISVLTKSPLVVRDIDILRKSNECEVGLTLTALDDDVRKAFELMAPSVEERLTALETLAMARIRTYAFIGPMLPYLTEKTLEMLLRRLRFAGVRKVLVDRLNIKCGNWLPIQEALKRHYPELLHRYKQAVFSGSDYFEEMRHRVMDSCREAGVQFELCY